MSTPKDTQTTSKNQIVITEWIPFSDVDWAKGRISTTADGAMAWGRAEVNEVAVNRTGFLVKNGCEPDLAVAIDQVHGTRIMHVGKADIGRGIKSPDTRIPEADGIVTNTPNLVLVTSHADCAPLFLLDEQHKAIGLVHAGWKGILSGICGNAIRKMIAEFYTEMNNLHVAVGPMISTVHYEVSEDLATQFIDKFGVQVINRVGECPHLDLFSCIVTDLLNNGLKLERIPDRPPCTFSNKEYSSYRRDGDGMTGMIALFCINS